MDLLRQTTLRDTKTAFRLPEGTTSTPTLFILEFPLGLLSPLEIVDISESEVKGAQLYDDGPFLCWNSPLGLLSSPGDCGEK